MPDAASRLQDDGAHAALQRMGIRGKTYRACADDATNFRGLVIESIFWSYRISSQNP
jgi:hypothetical protein